MATARVVKVFLLGVALVLAVLYTFIFIVTSTTSSGGVYHLENGSFREADDNYLQQQLPYQCALVWLRIPKTASTTVVRRFMTPLVKAANLTNTGIRPNTCVTNVGGCAGIWQGSQQQAANHIEDRSIIAPPDGISSRIHHSGGDSQRCLLSTSGEEETRCWEYDSSQSTVTRNAKNNKTSVAARFNAHPSLHTHVALDPSLFGWVLPRNPMLFSTFRRPVERLLSSFHYGIRLGGDRPGQVKVCSLPGVANLTHWQNRVVAARAAVTLENNYTLYHQALREYLDACRDVVSNVYVQFLDPMTKNVSVALQHLEKYVIVGMQGDLDESLQRWAKIAVSSCRDHPNINRIRKDLITEPRHVGAHFRQSVTLTESNGGDEDNNTAELASPTINELDADLQQLIRTLTVDDEVIFQRAEELYEEQGHWFKSSSVR